MSTPQSVLTAAPEAVSGTSSPNQYHLHSHDHDVQISYYPMGAGPLTVDGPIILAYQDAHRSPTFREKQPQTVLVADLGTCVTGTLQTTVDAGWTTATLLIPTVVLSSEQSTSVHTELITTVHSATLNGIGDPQRDHYTVTALRGEASRDALPL
jgi:hypothetical protein